MKTALFLAFFLLQHVFSHISGKMRSKILIWVFILAQTSVLGVYEEYHIFNDDPSFAYVNIKIQENIAIQKITVIMYVINWGSFMKILVIVFTILFHCAFLQYIHIF